MFYELDFKESRKKYQGKYFSGNNYGRDPHTTYIYVKKYFNQNDSVVDAIFYDNNDISDTVFVKNKGWCFNNEIVERWGYKRISKTQFYNEKDKLDKSKIFNSEDKYMLKAYAV